MIRYWLIPILLFAGLETRTFAATVGDAQLVAVARVDHNGMEFDTSNEDASFENDEQTANMPATSFFTWYGSNTVHNLRLILAGALGFLLVLLGLHLLMPSSTDRQPRQPKLPPCGTNACGCPHDQHTPHANNSAPQKPMSGANVGDFLPLGISLNHLNAIGQHMGSQRGAGSEQYDDLTAKITELEERLREVTRAASPPVQQQDITASSESLSRKTTLDRHSATVKLTTESSDVTSHATGNLIPGQQNETLCSRSESKIERTAIPDPLFDGLISETLAVINSH